MKTNEDGRSMIEMLGVLAIIGVLSVGGFSLVNKMHNSYEANQVIETAGELASRAITMAREYEEDENSKKASMNSYLCKAKAVPDIFLSEEFDDCANMVGANGITYNVEYIGDKVKYAVQIEGATEEMCVQIVTTNWGTPGSSGFMGLSVGTDVKAVNTGTASDTVALIGNKDHPAPMGIGAAASACSEDGLTINLSFR